MKEQMLKSKICGLLLIILNETDVIIAKKLWRNENKNSSDLVGKEGRKYKAAGGNDYRQTRLIVSEEVDLKKINTREFYASHDCFCECNRVTWTSQ